MATKIPRYPVTQREMDLARSVQDITEEVMLRMARTAHSETGSRNLCLAGGVALNCVGNGRLLREGPFDDIWIQPAAGDAGGALGVAYALWHRFLEKPRVSAEASGTWTVSGTTRNSSQASIITGVNRLPGICRDASSARNSVWPGCEKPAA